MVMFDVLVDCIITQHDDLSVLIMYQVCVCCCTCMIMMVLYSKWYYVRVCYMRVL